MYINYQNNYCDSQTINSHLRTIYTISGIPYNHLINLAKESYI